MTHRPLSYPSSLISWDGKALYWEPEKAFADLCLRRAAGLQHVMVGGLQYVEPAVCDLDAVARTYSGWLTDLGMSVSSHHCIQPTWADPAQSQEPVREMMRRTVATCAPLSAGALVVHPGNFLGRPDDPETFFAQYRELEARHGAARIMDTIAGNLRVFGEAAERHGTVIAVENVGRFEPFADLTSLPALIARVDHPCVGFCIDTGHAHAFAEAPTDWLRLAGAKLFDTHFNDNRGRGLAVHGPSGLVPSSKAVDEHLPLGFGTISWLDVVHALDELGYARPVSCETTGWPGDDEVSSLRQAVAWWRALETTAASRQ